MNARRLSGIQIYEAIATSLGYLSFFLAMAIAGLAGLKLDIGAVAHWAATCMGLVFFASLVYRRQIVQGKELAEKLPQYGFVYLPWLLLAVSVWISGALNGGDSLGTVLKYLALGLLLLFLVRFRPTHDATIISMSLLAVGSLFSLLLFSLFGQDDWLVLPPDRFGWAWVPPGVFWKTGIYLMPLACWWVLNQQLSGFVRWSLLILSCIVVGLDGSRTGSVLAMIILLVSTGLYGLRVGSLVTAIKRAVRLGLVMLVFLGGINPSGINPLSLVYPHVAELLATFWSFSPGSAGISESLGRDFGHDNIRLEMIKDSLNGVVTNFPFGGGFGSTVTQTASMTEPMVVHITYLQILSDLGVLGLFAYMAIFLVPIGHLWVRIREAQDRWQAFDHLILPIGILAIYLFSGLFHPISNEISEWLVVLVAMALSFPKSLKAGGQSWL